MSEDGSATMMTRGLHELTGGDDQQFGGKSAGLGELLRAEIPVPPGFALGISAFADFMAAAGLAPVAPVADVAQAAAIRTAIGSAPVPGAVRDEIAARYAELATAVGDPSPPMAVRSSALGEDGADATFAGQQDTILWVRGVPDICDAVRRCWASLYSTEAVSYRHRFGGAAAPAMGVTVQLMVDAAVSGVMFTCNPVSGDPSMVAINASWGLGLAVVGGEVTPDDYLVSKITGEVVRQTIGSKDVEYLPAPDGRGTVRADVAADRRTAPCLDDAARRALVDLSRRIERHFGGHQDIEWAIARGRPAPAGLSVLQTRPVTALPERPPAPAPVTSALSLVMSQFGAKPPPGG
jgi:pyruvate, water dikinase